MGYSRHVRRQQEKHGSRGSSEVKRALQAHQNRTRAHRANTGVVSAGTHTAITFTWPTPFDDNNYTVMPTMEDNNTQDTLRIRKVLSKTATSVTLSIENNDTSNHGGIVHLLGIPDGS